MYVCYVLLNCTYLKTKKWGNMKIKTDMVKNIGKSPGSQWSQSRRRKKPGWEGFVEKRRF